MNGLDKYRNDIEKLCSTHSVKFLYVFGSSITDRFSDTSDIDLLVRFSPIDLKNYFSNFLDFKSQLESVFHRKVDLVEEQTVKNPILKNSIERTKMLIYG